MYILSWLIFSSSTQKKGHTEDLNKYTFFFNFLNYSMFFSVTQCLSIILFLSCEISSVLHLEDSSSIKKFTNFYLRRILGVVSIDVRKEFFLNLHNFEKKKVIDININIIKKNAKKIQIVQCF